MWRYGGFHSLRDIAGRGVAVMVMLVALLAGAAAIRLAMMEHFGITSTAVEFEIRMPRALAQAARSEVQVELRTDLNQTVALLRDQWQAFDDGRVVVSGRVPIRFKTTQRMMALNLPGQPTRLFKLRLAANPSPSDTFGPWIQVDAVDADTPFAERMKMTDGFAIRYRAL
ncbi:MAG: hypothetical protein EPO23_01130 [Xanthobacteraceae bacterium]|nr:MAG: hypothetical protein EPO23_01130 [Xanthobacteraceae bacterium]